MRRPREDGRGGGDGGGRMRKNVRVPSANLNIELRGCR